MSCESENQCSCHADTELATHNAAYRRALWIVASLNFGFGIVEAVGGFIAKSQSLKADALDFLGDGSITFLALLALGWSGRTRARVALAQGFFLAALGLGVIAGAIWRVFGIRLPQAEMMGALGIVGLIVNVVAAFMLFRFRKMGDASARAIWLFSRNDALANIAVIIAAGLVAWSQTGWPDLIVAAIIAALFLHSAWEIVRDSMRELTEAKLVRE